MAVLRESLASAYLLMQQVFFKQHRGGERTLRWVPASPIASGMIFICKFGERCFFPEICSVDLTGRLPVEAPVPVSLGLGNVDEWVWWFSNGGLFIH